MAVASRTGSMIKRACQLTSQSDCQIATAGIDKTQGQVQNLGGDIIFGNITPDRISVNRKIDRAAKGGNHTIEISRSNGEGEGFWIKWISAISIQ